MLKNKRIKILNCYVDGLTMKETIREVEEIIERGKPTQHVVVNAGKMVLLQKDERLRNIVNQCEIINADGQAVVWASRFLNEPLPERVAGIDLFLELVKLSEQKGYKIFLFGAREEVVTKVASIFKKQYPDIKIVGCRNGYFTSGENKKIVDQINDSKADMLFLGFSSPQKEYWLADHLKEIKVPFCMGVGGSFDVIAGVTKRAPKWMQNIGLEWFYRFAQEPQRMWKRYLVGNSKFISLVIKERFMKK